MTSQDWSGRVFVWTGVLGLLLFGTGLALGTLVGLRLEEGPKDDAQFEPVYPSVSAPWILRSESVFEELAVEPERRQKVQDLLLDHRKREKELREELEELSATTQANLQKVLSPEERERLDEIRRRYSVPHLEDEATRELAILRREVGLDAEQQPVVYQITYDALKEKREAFHKFWRDARGKRPSRELQEAFREALRLSDERALERLGPHLTSVQLDTYRRVLDERRHPFRGRGGPRGGESRDDCEEEDGQKTGVQGGPNPGPHPGDWEGRRKRDADGREGRRRRGDGERRRDGESKDETGASGASDASGDPDAPETPAAESPEEVKPAESPSRSPSSSSPKTSAPETKTPEARAERRRSQKTLEVA